MLGHHVSDEFIKKLETQDKVYLGQIEGKLVEAVDNIKPIVALIKKSDSEVFKLNLEERAELDHDKILMVTVGSSKNLSEVFIPSRYFENAEYEGRPFLHGLFDCYTLVRDYYRKEFNLILPTNIQRTWEWWQGGENLYVENAKFFNFEEVQNLQKHDLIVMNLMSPVPNHGAIYLGDNKILHHQAGKFSTIQNLTFSLKSKISVIYRNKAI